jgi:hypothetical protein
LWSNSLRRDNPFPQTGCALVRINNVSRQAIQAGLSIYYRPSRPIVPILTFHHRAKGTDSRIKIDGYCGYGAVLTVEREFVNWKSGAIDSNSLVGDSDISSIWI